MTNSSLSDIIYNMMNLTKHVEISLDQEDNDVAIEIRYFENDEWIGDSYMSSWQETIVEIQKYLSDNNTNNFNNPVYLPFDAVSH